MSDHAVLLNSIADEIDGIVVDAINIDDPIIRNIEEYLGGLGNTKHIPKSSVLKLLGHAFRFRPRWIPLNPITLRLGIKF